ncbi:glycosyltransferase family 4 protein [Aequorivita echinoideorum]|uniref:Glycosyltransferase family 4 protein n=1 Tax=Aequorivita echinoideorum TaxID=1549647 RepID=A0ABS5S3Z0_9FLAO|nr:glycosyltransferase family 4 protein [Aequorivita echinoideorum]MBT0607927.1 glycosyltransferase family 4 protein [Aequorivita echinoideorum]
MRHYINLQKLIRITTVPISLEKLLEGQLVFMQDYFEVTAISAEKKKLEQLGKTLGYNTHHIEMTRQITPLRDIKAVWKLYNYLKKEKPMIVHTHTPKAGIVGMLAAWLAGVPNRLHTVAGLPLMEVTGAKRKLLNFVERLTYHFATKVYPNSKGLYDFILAEKFTDAEKLDIIGQGSSNGIDTSYFNPALFDDAAKKQLRLQLGIKETNFVFVFVGRLVGDKGINELVEAFGEMNSRFKVQDLKGEQKDSSNDGYKDQESKEGQSQSLLLVGPFESELDPLKSETLKTIADDPNIISVGYQNDVRPYLAIADALVFPSYREGFPNVVMQAGAMGLPAIVTNINGCNEIIAEGVNGIIVPPKNMEGLKVAMKQLSSKALLYENLQANARPMIVERFERREVWDALLREYFFLINN